MSARSWTQGNRWLVALGLALFIAIAVARGLYTIPHLVGPSENIRNGPAAVAIGNAQQAGFKDYRDTVWLPVRDLQSGGNPYDALAYQDRHPYAFEFTYLPAQLTLFFPLAQLPWTPSAIVWFVALIASALLLGWATVWISGLPRRLDILLAVACGILLLKPMAYMIQAGQTSIVPLIATVVALGRRKSDVLTTICVALAWIKPQFGVPLVVILWALDCRRPIVRGTILAALVSLPAAVWAMVNAGGVVPFLTALPSGATMAVSERSTETVTSDVTSLFEYLSGGSSSSVAILAGFLVVMFLSVVAVLVLTRYESESFLLVFVIAVLSVLLSTQHVGYDLAILIPAVAVCALAAQRSWALGAAKPSTWLWTSLTLLLALALVPRGTDAVEARDVQLTLALIVLVALLVLTMTGRGNWRPILALVAIVAVLAVLRFGLDAAGADEATAHGALPSLALLTAWLLCLAWVLARYRSHRERSQKQQGSGVLSEAAESK